MNRIQSFNIWLKWWCQEQGFRFIPETKNASGMQRSYVRGRFYLNLRKTGPVAYKNQKSYKQDFKSKNVRKKSREEDSMIQCVMLLQIKMKKMENRKQKPTCILCLTNTHLSTESRQNTGTDTCIQMVSI